MVILTQIQLHLTIKQIRFLMFSYQRRAQRHARRTPCHAASAEYVAAAAGAPPTWLCPAATKAQLQLLLLNMQPPRTRVLVGSVLLLLLLNMQPPPPPPLGALANPPLRTTLNWLKFRSLTCRLPTLPKWSSWITKVVRVFKIIT